MKGQLRFIASEIVNTKIELVELQAEEVRKDEARERRNAVMRETGKIEALINQRRGQVGYNVENC